MAKGLSTEELDAMTDVELLEEAQGVQGGAVQSAFLRGNPSP